MLRFLLVCLGGAVGTGVRYLLAQWAWRTFGDGFPVGTLLVNAVGSFLIALLMVVGLETDALSPTARAVLTMGVLGGFTTYSAFSFETLRLLQDGRALAAFGYAAATLCGCLLLCALGHCCGRWLVGAA